MSNPVGPAEPVSEQNADEPLVVERRGRVAVLTLNKPDQLNAVDDVLHRRLRRVWDVLAADETVGAAVLTGAGRAFSAGGSIDHLQRLHDDPAHRRESIREAERLARAMISCEVPVVAAVNGPAVGLGASLAVLCDLVVMSEESYLCDPHVSNGVVAGDGGPVVWPLLTSLVRAKEYLLLCDRVPAHECERIGLANRVVPREDVLDTALALAERLAAQPSRALRDTKRALNLHLQDSANRVLDFALAAEGESFASDDVLNAIKRFRQSARQ
jgi:enoyl-CoA hydratase